MTTGTSASIDTVVSLRSYSGASPTSGQVYTFDAQGHSTIDDDGGGTFAYVSSDIGGALFTGSISGTTLTVSAVASGTLAVGQYVSGSPTAVSAGTQITALGTGTGGTGTYTINNSQTIASETMTTDPASGALFTGSISGTTLTISAVTNGTLAVGQYISGSPTAVSAGTQITALGTGSGGTGTYTVNNSQTVTSETMTADNGGTIIVDQAGRRWYRLMPTPAINVDWFGADRTGTNDSAAAIQSALNAGYDKVYHQGSHKCLSGLVIPPGVEFTGLAIAPGNDGGPSGDTLIFGNTVSPCITLNNSGANQASAFRSTIISRSGTASSSVIGLQVQGAYNTILSDLFAYNHGIGYYLQSPGNLTTPDLQNAISCNAYNLYTGAIYGSHIVFDTWPEFRCVGGRFGMNGVGDAAGSEFIKITAPNGGSGGSGPNTIRFVNLNFNQGEPGPAHWINFTNVQSEPGNQGEFSFDDCHVENITGAVIVSSSTVPWLRTFNLGGGTVINCPSQSFFSLNPATNVAEVMIGDAFIYCTDVTLAPGAGASFTGSIAPGPGSTGTLTVSAVESGALVVGQYIYGSDVNSGTEVVALGTGSGGTGTYIVNNSQTVSSEPMTQGNIASFTGSIAPGPGSLGTLTVSAVASGTLLLGQYIVTGGGVIGGTEIVQLGTGTGGIGTYLVNISQTVSSEAMTASSGWINQFGISNTQISGNVSITGPSNEPYLPNSMSMDAATFIGGNLTIAGSWDSLNIQAGAGSFSNYATQYSTSSEHLFRIPKLYASSVRQVEEDIYSYNGGFPLVNYHTARGTAGAPAVSQASDIGLVLQAYCYDGSNTNCMGLIRFQTNGTPSTGSTPGIFIVSTSSSGSSTPTDRWALNSNGTLYPLTDNTYSLGGSGFRTSSLWSANGTIQTSDGSQKAGLADATLGLDWINSLRPRSFRWKVGGKEVVRQVWRDDQGKEVDSNAKGARPAEFVTRNVPGKRTHWGFVAQEVKASLPAGIDFGGWIKTDPADPESEEALRYDQFIAPLVKAIQELSAEVQALKKKI